MNASNHVRIVEVGARDGLQNEKTLLPAQVKIALIDRLSSTGLKTIEATSFVSPKWVPQLADAAEVFAGIRKAPGVSYPVLVPNLQGYERALRGRRDRDRSLQRGIGGVQPQEHQCLDRRIDRALHAGDGACASRRRQGARLRLHRARLPLPGRGATRRCGPRGKRLHELGCYEVSLGDTIGVGTPTSARAMLQAVAQAVPMSALAVHFHDTYGQALANILACLEEGVRVIDSAVSGTGGCPYAKGATGNVASEDVVYMLQGMGMDTGIDLDLLVATGAWLAAQLHKETASRVTRARTAAA